MNYSDYVVMLSTLEKAYFEKDKDFLIKVKKYLENKLISLEVDDNSKILTETQIKYLFYTLNEFCDEFLTDEDKLHFRRRTLIKEIISILGLNREDLKTKNHAWSNRLPEDNFGNVFRVYQLLDISNSLKFRLGKTTTLNMLISYLKNIGITFEKLTEEQKGLISDKSSKFDIEYALKLIYKTF